MNSPLALALRLFQHLTLKALRCHVAELDLTVTGALQPHHRTGFDVVLVPTWAGGRAAVAVHWTVQGTDEARRALVYSEP